MDRNFWLSILLIAFVVMLYPLVRWFIKRILLFLKITIVCKKNKYKLHKNYTFWFFKDKHSKTCDFYIETKNEVYSIKLFGVKRRASVLKFLENNKYFIRNYIILAGRSFLTLNLDSKIREIPEYNFFYKYNGIWHLKKHHNILLINPSCIDFQYQFKTNCYTGDKIEDMEIHSLSGLIKHLKRSEIPKY